eukprot:TRINITY_DN59180_c0_g1_i2.p1 TRINITY_DN59180_c0_g1~~TRINITY_DN59180_c0_g1_i2.p1  ORF type:complete len:266 (-),score=19.57 TRINITY_DN59180_c0_g1_i2:413-1210(-)
MYSPLQLGVRYLRYYFQSSNGKGHGMHSPFVFAFITQVMNDNRHFYAYENIERLRGSLLSNEAKLAIQDFGAGSRVKKENVRKVKDIARSSLKPKKFGQLLFRMVAHYQPRTILELGTSLGVTSAYLSSAKTDAQLVTMEGATEVAALAKANFRSLALENIRVVEGNFDDTLPATVQQMPSIDFAFVDGNHRYEPTVRYYRQLLPAMHEHSILVFDDIHWSREMEQAWNEIRNDEAVTLSIDLSFIGIVFFRKEQKVKQHFSIRF